MRCALLIGLLSASLAVGCGGSDSDGGVQGEKSQNGGRVLNSENPRNIEQYTEQEVSRKLGLSEEGYLGRQECVASVILTTPGSIALYADAGDVVATNEAGTVGVKVGTFEGESQTECASRFAKLLSERLP